MMWGKDREMPVPTAEPEQHVERPDPHEEVRSIAANFATMSKETAAWFLGLPLEEKKDWMGKMHYVVDARRRGLFDEFKLAPITYEEQRKAESERKHLEFARYLITSKRITRSLEG